MTYSVISYIPYMLEGLYWTLALVAGGLALGFLIGLPVALGEVYGGRIVETVLRIYVWFFRGVPLLVLLFLFHWGVLPLLGLNPSPLFTSVLVLGMRSGAYQSQIFRGAISAIKWGEIQAARALGMTRLQEIVYIVIPQALRIALPGWSNEYAIILKDSAVCFTLGVVEVLTRAKYIAISTGVHLLPYLFAGLMFLVLTYMGTGFINKIYARISVPGLVGAEKT